MEVEGEPQQPPSRARHINKRALKNKALAVSFNEKDLKDYVTGFHKRKKKRRKVAQKQQEEVLRRKRIENRKKRKLERLLISGASTVSEENDEYQEDQEDIEPIASANGTMEYDNGDMKVTVKTSEISGEDNKVEQSRKKTETVVPRLTSGDDIKKQQSLGVSKKKVFKNVSKNRSHSKRQSKGDRNKGKGKGKKNQKR
ncbi:ribosomal RNA-processing protein 17 [Euphorbia lathyris]|uniref:ribosomal RNA-processing protein 17 n=1 Tax=Euphorbia lathyris TaxID=212925 RepID=UPI003313E719